MENNEIEKTEVKKKENLYDKVNIKPRDLTVVILVSLLVIIGLIVFSALKH